MGRLATQTHRATPRRASVTKIADAVTVRALQRRVGSYPDGAWGPDTTRALQRYLNAR